MDPRVNYENRNFNACCAPLPAQPSADSLIMSVPPIMQVVALGGGEPIVYQGLVGGGGVINITYIASAFLM